MDDDIFVYFVNLPDGVNEAVLECATGYTIYIDPRQSKAGIARSYQHAFNHIRRNDFNNVDVQKIEGEAHL